MADVVLMGEPDEEPDLVKYRFGTGPVRVYHPSSNPDNNKQEVMVVTYPDNPLTPQENQKIAKLIADGMKCGQAILLSDDGMKKWTVATIGNDGRFSDEPPMMIAPLSALVSDKKWFSISPDQRKRIMDIIDEAKE